MLPPPSSTIAGAPHPVLPVPRQVTAPRPNEPPTMNPPLFMPGTTTTQAALSSTPPGMPLSAADMISLNALAAFASLSSVSLSASSRLLESESNSNSAVTYIVLMRSSPPVTIACCAPRCDTQHEWFEPRVAPGSGTPLEQERGHERARSPRHVVPGGRHALNPRRFCA